MSDLSFFNPMYLWGLLFLLIPLAIHFLNRQRTIKLDFSSLRFLQKEAVKSNRVRRWKKILLLITRLLLIILIILLFSQLYNKKDPFRIISSSNTALYCWVDPTVSMDYRYNEQSLWREASTMIAVFDSILPPGSRLLCYDDRIENFTDIRMEKLSGSVEEALTPLRHGTSDFENMVQRFYDMKKEVTHTPVLALFSDFQAKGSLALLEFFNADTLSYPVILISLSDDHPWNYAITSAHIVPDNNPTLKCHIHAYGKKLATTEVVTLIESMRTGRNTIELNKNDSMSLSVGIPHHSDRNWGQVRLMAKDPWAFDNDRYFIEKARGKKKVLILSEGEESFPVTAALRTAGQTSLYPPVSRHPMDVSYEDMDSSDIIIIADVKEPTSILSSLWSNNVFSDKVILFAPDVSEKQGSLNSILFNYLKIKQKNKVVRSAKPLYPVLPDTVSSVWKGFPRFSDKDVAVYDYYSHIPGNPLLRLNNGTTLISYILEKNGLSWILFATPITITEANNLCETGFFLPLVDRVIHFGIKTVVTTEDNWIAGDPRSNPYSGRRISAQIFDSDNKRVALWDRQEQVLMENPGIYKIVPEGEPAQWIAVNTDPSEGVLNYTIPDGADYNKKFIKVIDRNGFENFIRHHKSPGFDFLWLVLAGLLLIEVLLWKKSYTS